MSEFILELLSEEMPARMQEAAAMQLKQTLTRQLTAARLGFEQIDVHVTPRRLVALVRGLPLQQPDFQEERKGPRITAPEAALQGFLTSTGLRKEQLTIVDDKKGAYYSAPIHQPGQAAEAVLASLVAEIISGFDWPKSMRWGSDALRWVRPLRAIIAVFNGQPLPGGIDRATGHYTQDDRATVLRYSNQTIGHRLSRQPVFTVTDGANYQQQLAKAYVILDREERRKHILDGITTLTTAKNLVCHPEPRLLDEVLGLVDYPVVLMGRMDAAFMTLPPEVLMTSMKVHQRYFPCHHPDGTLAPYFLTVSNNPNAAPDSPIIKGNERVLRARLSDALFFWEQDRRRSLADFAPDLSKRVFHEKVGTLADKAKRMATLAQEIATILCPEQVGECVQAAALCKADLATDMVGEFPELQGIMGGYYAKEDGLPAAISEAIRDHYAPQGEGKPVPTASVSIVTALADKVDTLVALTVAGVPYSGSKDPYALRRTMLGILRLLTENKRDLDVLAFAAAHQRHFADATAASLSTLRERLLAVAQGYLASRGHRADVIAALLPTDNTFIIHRIDRRCQILQGAIHTPEGQALMAASKRVSNILQPTAKPEAFNEQQLQHPAEKTLWQALLAYDKQNLSEYADQLRALSCLHPLLDRFFTEVLVNDPPFMVNRQALLAQVRRRLHTIGNLDKLDGTA